MNVLKAAIVGLALMSGNTLVRADVITDWNRTAIDVMKAVNVAGNPWTRSMALVNVSMSDAVNSVQKRYSRYMATELPIDPNASAEAAAAAAAREILMRQYPGQKAQIDAAFAETMQAIPDNPARVAGIALGEKVAAAVFTERQSDATNAPDTYRPLTTPGVWVPTTLPLFPQYATAKPWGMDSASQFRPGPPPALNSALYARDYNETREMGAVKSTKRTDAQSDAVRFWTQANLGPAWFQAAWQVSARRGLSVAESARVFALMSMALANCFIVDWDAKFQYNFWRPITAIRNGDIDRNDATERDASWVPFIETPMHPEYPCAHCIVSGTIGGLIKATVGNNIKLSNTSPTLPGKTRSWNTADEFMQEVALGRIYDGVHYRNSTEVGNAMGQKIGEFAANKYLK